jgi:hypothetical protein
MMFCRVSVHWLWPIAICVFRVVVLAALCLAIRQVAMPAWRLAPIYGDHVEQFGSPSRDYHAHGRYVGEKWLWSEWMFEGRRHYVDVSLTICRVMVVLCVACAAYSLLLATDAYRLGAKVPVIACSLAAGSTVLGVLLAFPRWRCDAQIVFESTADVRTVTVSLAETSRGSAFGGMIDGRSGSVYVDSPWMACEAAFICLMTLTGAVVLAEIRNLFQRPVQIHHRSQVEREPP